MVRLAGAYLRSGGAARSAGMDAGELRVPDLAAPQRTRSSGVVASCSRRLLLQRLRYRGAPLVRICHLSWEYPPVVYGGLGRHVHAIAREQARAGHEVVV